MSRRSLKLTLAFAMAFVCAVTGRAAVLVNDTWIDGTDSDPASPTFSENGVDGDADGNLESVWFKGGAGTLDPVGPGGPERGSGFGGSSASWTTYFTPEGSEVNLTQTGDSLKLTWQFTTGDVNASNSSQNFRIALVDSPAVARVNADGSPGSAAYTGYGMFNNMGETFNRSNPIQIVQRAGASGALLSGSGDWASVGTFGGASGNTGFADNTQYTLVWTITRNASNNLDLTATFSGGNINGSGSVVATASDVAPNNGGFKFDTFGIRPTNETTTSTVFDTNLFKVEFNRVPEPASAALLVMAGLAIVRRRRLY